MVLEEGYREVVMLLVQCLMVQWKVGGSLLLR